jgi:HAD superfamily hydrolase (TIGR01549 family)
LNVAKKSPKPKREIKAVIFDYGGTLFKATRPWEEIRVDGIAAVHGLLKESGLKMGAREFHQFAESVFLEYAEREAKEDRDIGDRTKYEDMVGRLFPDISKARKAALAAKANRAFWEVAVRTYPMRKSTPKALRDLRSTGVKMGIVSNHHDFDSLVGHLEEAGIAGHFESVLASEREGVRKPNTEIFARSLKALGVEKEHAIFVGDSPKHDILGARAAGITSVLIDDKEQPDTWAVPGSKPAEDVLPDYVVTDLLAVRGIVVALRGAKGRKRPAARAHGKSLRRTQAR